jgi:uncharacterized protein (TIGR03546 family)
MFFKSIAKLIIAINANTKPGHISGGFSFAILLSFLPQNLFWFVLLFIIFFLKVNLGVVFIFTGIFGLITPLATGLLNSIGYTIGNLPVVYNFLGFLNNIPVISLLGFDNTLTIGGLIAGIVLFVPSYFLFNLIITLYRKLVRDRLAQTKLVKKILLLPVISKLAEAVKAAYMMYVKVM